MSTEPISFDIETSGLSIHSQFKVACDSRDIASYFYCPVTYVDELVEGILGGHPIAGHNIVAFDLPKLIYEELKHRRRSRLLHALWKNPGSILDTYIASKFMRGRVSGNSMEDWVKYLKDAGNNRVVTKHHIEDFSLASDDDLNERVTGDVINQHEMTLWFLEEYGEGFKNLPTYTHLHYFFMFYMEGLARGVVVDETRKETTLAKLNRSLRRKEREIYRAFGPINCNSNAQINKALEDKYGEGLPLGLPSKKTKKRSPKMNKDNRFEVTGRFTETNLIYEWREWYQQRGFLLEEGGKSFFMEGAYKNGRVYPKGSPMAQPLLRSHYTQPMMNQAMKKVRFVCHNDKYRWIGCDIVALEWSIFANLLAMPPYNNHSIMPETRGEECPKQKTINSFKNFFTHFPEDEWKDKAKTLNYAIIFGQQDPSSLYFFGADPSRMEEFKECKEDRFPGFQELENDLKQQYNRGKLRNMYGIDVPVQSHALINGVIQSMGALYSYMILGLFWKRLKESLPSVEPVLHNHDELQCVVPRIIPLETVQTKTEEAKNWTVDNFTNITEYPTYAGLDVQIGDDWGASH